MSSNWNPLYPSNDYVDPLEEAAREAEWEDSMKELDEARRKRKRLTDEDDELEDIFL